MSNPKMEYTCQMRFGGTAVKGWNHLVFRLAVKAKS